MMLRRPRRQWDRVVARVDGMVGGSARRQVVVTFAAVLGLDSADKATIGANATQLEAALSINRTQIGLLLTVTSLIGAAATIPAGIFVDRVSRTRLLAGAVTLWAAAMVWSGLATGYASLLGARVLLGAVTAAAGPAIASMVGDYVPVKDRGRVYGYVLSGELIGAGFGFIVAGELATLSWRAPYFALVPPTLLVWWLLHRLPEPARGGASWLPEGASRITEATPDSGEATMPDGETPGPADEAATDGREGLAHGVADRSGVEPRPESVLCQDPARLDFRAAVGYVLRVRTNVVLILASALGYVYFSGIRGFGVEFVKSHYGVSQGVASSMSLVLGIGALAGVLMGGRLADGLLRRGRLTSRVEVAGCSVLAAGLLFIPALLTNSIWLALPLLVLAAAFLGATNPPLDAARLDIIHPRVWGRAEAVRTVLRDGADAAAPLLFGFLSVSVLGTGDAGLQHTFLVMLVPLFVAALITLVWGRRTYPRDVAAARRSAESEGHGPGPAGN